MTRKMYRYEVAVDDQPHRISLTGDPLHVAAASTFGPVEFWAEHTEGGGRAVSRFFQVFGTGHPLPDGAEWIGTCPRTPDGLVWHLYQLTQV